MRGSLGRIRKVWLFWRSGRKVWRIWRSGISEEVGPHWGRGGGLVRVVVGGDACGNGEGARGRVDGEAVEDVAQKQGLGLEVALDCA